MPAERGLRRQFFHGYKRGLEVSRAVAETLEQRTLFAFSAVPTYESVGLYWSPTSGGGAGVEATVRYKVAGTSTWKTGHNMPYMAAEDTRPAEFRGSVVMLQPGTTYDVEVDTPTGAAEQYQFTTRSNDLPILRTVVVTDMSTPLVIDGVTDGSDAGYVLYTGPATIDVANAYDFNVQIKNSHHVILRGLTLTGAKRNGVLLGSSLSNNADNVSDIVIENNDISNWGTVDPAMPAGSNWGYDDDSGIRSNSSNLYRITIQRNKIHHPRTDTNSWKEDRNGDGSGDHPQGPQGITFENNNKKGELVVRYNEIYSDNDHRFNDGMGSDQNFGYAGFPARDSDIYGNIVTYTWDDGYEIEGANMNVRVWGNYTDYTYTGVAMAGTAMGPLYVFRNVFGKSQTGNSPYNSYGGVTFKRQGGSSVPSDGYEYVYNNTTYNQATPMFQAGITQSGSGPYATHTITRNNILRVRQSSDNSIADPLADSVSGSSYDYDLYNGNLSTPNMTPQETHGIHGTPTYAAGSGFNSTTNTGSFQLTSTSNGYDDGLAIPNFSDTYIGAAPDMGAHEAGSAVMEFGVNAYPFADTTAPAAITNLGVSSTTSGSATISWTAPGDSGNTGTATSYDVRYSTSPITDANFASATLATGIPAPAIAGTAQSMTISGLSATTTYYFAIKTSDEVPNQSAISNVPSGTTLPISWDGPATGTWTTATNWTHDNIPDQATEGVRIDANPSQSTTVTYTLLNGQSANIGSLTIDAADALILNKDTTAGTATMTINGTLANAGTLTAGGSSAGSAHGHYFTVTITTGGTFNTASGVLYIKSLTSYRRNSSSFFQPMGSTNAGTIYVQNVSSQGSGYVRFALSGTGTFTNSGTINVEGRGSTAGNNQPWALIGPSTASSTLTLAGSGTINLSSNLGDRTDSYAMLTGLATGTSLSNGASHTIEGNGYVGYAGTSGSLGNNITVYSFGSITNAGLIRALGTADLMQLTIANNGGSVTNSSGGRIVASGAAGTILKIGSDTTATTLSNSGLIEARSGRSVVLGTAVTGTLGGSIRGAGTFTGTLALGTAATLEPGDSANDNGTGASTAGTLGVTGSLALASTTALNYQLGAVGSGSDTATVSGALTLDGVINVSALSGFGAGTYRIFTAGSITNNGLTVGTMPSGYTGSIVVGAGTVDLVVTGSGQFMLSGATVSGKQVQKTTTTSLADDVLGTGGKYRAGALIDSVKG